MTEFELVKARPCGAGDPRGVLGLTDLCAGFLSLFVELEPLGVGVKLAVLDENQIFALDLGHKPLIETGEHGAQRAVVLDVLLLLLLEHFRLLLFAQVTLFFATEGGLISARRITGRDGQEDEEREKTSHNFML